MHGTTKVKYMSIMNRNRIGILAEIYGIGHDFVPMSKIRRVSENYLIVNRRWYVKKLTAIVSRVCGHRHERRSEYGV